VARKKFNLKDLINERHIKYKIMCGELEVEDYDIFEKIKTKPKHENSEIFEFQMRKKKLNHKKRSTR